MTLIAARSPAGDSDTSLAKSYIRVVIVEILVVSGLYWAGRYFG